MALDDALGVADGRQVDAFVPAQQEVQVAPEGGLRGRVQLDPDRGRAASQFAN
jgi:hypothetical protein